uniref:Uncharacterized protein n=1 Tax=Nelumbo nucifera TaxID=4432 RepID=A0A822ZPE9_NELNU|nr:TPA_asm: hypothetical protein HUJ06_003641 [Nelumbo nucifera]
MKSKKAYKEIKTTKYFLQTKFQVKHNI